MPGPDLLLLPPRERRGAGAEQLAAQRRGDGTQAGHGAGEVLDRHGDGVANTGHRLDGVDQQLPC